MTTLVLQAAGAALGSAFGGPVGAAFGKALGGLAGSALDAALFGDDSPRHVEGPRLSEMDGLASTEGAPIPRVYGRARIGGQLIWATRFEEVIATSVERSGTTGGKGAPHPKTVRTTYSYFANLAVGLCEGEIAFVRRIWADGRELDLAPLTLRVHRGTADQPPDPLIVAKEGAENTPAYRGLAYVVFERLPLAEFGNRVPQLSFEVVRPVEGLGSMIRAVCLIPGAAELAYDPSPVTQILGLGATQPENRHQLQRGSDVAASLDALQALCPNLERVSLVVSWFGDDLRAGACTVAPRVDRTWKRTYGDEWRVAGLSRGEARAVSEAGGGPAYGGTPSDGGVARLIRDLRGRGLAVVLYPFVMMDVPGANALPDPRSGAPGQPPYPWRGRITCLASSEGTSAADGEVEAFFGTVPAAAFDVVGGEVAYAGPEEWSFRRLALHYAHLALAAGGVEGFVIGSELVGLTRVRSGPGAYPAVAEGATRGGPARGARPGDEAHLCGGLDGVRRARARRRRGGALPARSALGSSRHRCRRDRLLSADLRLARRGEPCRPRGGAQQPRPRLPRRPPRRRRGVRLVLRQRRGPRGPAPDRDHGRCLRQAVDVPRQGSPRLVVEPARRTRRRPRDRGDGVAAGPKTDLADRDRHPGRRQGPERPQRVLGPEIVRVGLPAVLARDPRRPDPGARSGSHPVARRGARNQPDLARLRRANGRSRLRVRLGLGRAAVPRLPGLFAGLVGRAELRDRALDDGRLEGVPLDRLVGAILADFGVDAARPALDGFVEGYVVDRPMSARAALEPLARLFGADAVASAGALAWRGRGGVPVVTITPEDLVSDDPGPLVRLVRAQESELPLEVQLGFTDADSEYRRAVVASRRLTGASRREARAETGTVLRRSEAQRLADSWLQDLWAGREQAEFAVSPRWVAIEPGDIVAVPTRAGPRLHRVTRITDGAARRLSTRAVEPGVFEAPSGAPATVVRRPPRVAGRAEAVLLDLPAARADPAVLQYLAVAAEPWPGAVAVWRSGDGASFALHRVIDARAVIGRTLTSFAPGPLWRWDRVASLDVELSSGALSSVTDEAALAGPNLFAIEGEGGAWEIVSAARAELLAERRYRLSRFLRGLGGSEAAAARSVPSGARIVRLDATVAPLASALEDLGRVWR